MLHSSRVFATCALAFVFVFSSVCFVGVKNVSAASVATTKPAMTVTVDRAGIVKLEGTLVSVSGNLLVVNSWGGAWTVDVSSAKLLNKQNGIASISQFTGGDQLTIAGTAKTSGWQIVATKVQNMSLLVRSVAPSGVISNLGSSSFTLTTSAGKAYLVSWDSTTTVLLDKRYMTPAVLKNGMKAIVRGMLDKNDITVIASRIEARAVTETSTVKKTVVPSTGAGIR